jgi:hypothetical protein
VERPKRERVVADAQRAPDRCIVHVERHPVGVFGATTPPTPFRKGGVEPLASQASTNRSVIAEFPERVELDELACS